MLKCDPGIYKDYLVSLDSLIKSNVLKVVREDTISRLFIEKGNIDRENISGNAILFFKDDMASLFTNITVNILSFLESKGISTYLVHSDFNINQKALIVRNVNKIPLKIVYRNIAYGYEFLKLKRNKELEIGDVLNTYEICLETSNKNWRGILLKNDNPLIIEKDNHWEVSDSDTNEKYFDMLPLVSDSKMDSIYSLTKFAKNLLTVEFAKHSVDLLDISFEFGFDPVEGKLLLLGVYPFNNINLSFKGYINKSKYIFLDDTRIPKTDLGYYRLLESVTSEFVK